jgi:hypothetical protein
MDSERRTERILDVGKEEIEPVARNAVVHPYPRVCWRRQGRGPRRGGPGRCTTFNCACGAAASQLETAITPDCAHEIRHDERSERSEYAGANAVKELHRDQPLSVDAAAGVK